MENRLTVEDINNQTIMSILEIQGIRFTQNKFQIEIILKSILVLKEKIVFNKSLFQLSNDNSNIIIRESPRETKSTSPVTTPPTSPKANLEPFSHFAPEPESEPEQVKPSEDIVLDIDDISEVFHIEPTENAMVLKDRNQIYYDLFKKAKTEAKIAKKNALAAYLHAKSIKDSNFLDIDDSDSDSDLESVIKKLQ